MFGWWFGLNEGYPRGQLSANMMVAEVGTDDAWYRAFDAPHMDKFDAPTVDGVDFPAMGIYQACNDTDSGTLHVGTYAASPDRRGVDTSWRVTNLPNTDEVFVLCDGEPFTRFAVDGPNAIRLDGTIDLRHYQIFTGYRGSGARAAEARRREESPRACCIRRRGHGGWSGRRNRVPLASPACGGHQQQLLVRGGADLLLLQGVERDHHVHARVCRSGPISSSRRAATRSTRQRNLIGLLGSRLRT